MKRNVLLLTLLFNLEKINCITGPDVLACLSGTAMVIGLGAFCRTQICDCTSRAEDNICAKVNLECDNCLLQKAAKSESKPLLKNKGQGTGPITKQPTNGQQ